MENIIKALQQGASIIDVRTPEEYRGGHVSGSKNIPLGEISERIEEIKNSQQPIIFCCASGGRSGQATRFFQQQGVNCINGGSWFDVQLANQQ
jgi:rhodanese-related sulfurtransferase